MKEKLSIEGDMKAHGEELNNWVELSEKTFNFARYARAWFANGDLETKRAILACLSSNPTLKDQRIIFNMQKPFQAIFEKRDLAEDELNRLEPQDAPAKMQGRNDFEEKFPVMSG